MALTFNNATSDRVDHGNVGTDPAALTVYLWMYPTSYLTTRRILAKINPSGGAGMAFNFPGTSPNRLRVTIGYAITSADSISADNVITLNAWNFAAFTFDGVTAPKIFTGSLTSLAVETSYTGTPTAPSGARSTDGGGSLVVGNSSAANSSFPGAIAVVNWIPAALSVGELQSHQFKPRSHPSSKLYTQYGYNGTGSQPDWSGNGNAGTVTGATQSAHAPLAPMFGGNSTQPYIVAAAAFKAAWASPYNRLIGGGSVS